MARSTTAYLTNKELLAEIHKSKMTYVELDSPDHNMYDVIVYDLDVFMDDDVCTEHHGEWKVVYDIPILNKMTKETELIRVEDEITNLWAFNNHKDAGKRIILSIELIKAITTEEFIITIKQNKAKKINKAGTNNGVKLTSDDFLTGDLNIRLMTYNHIPLDENWNPEKPKTKAKDGYIKVNFPPFQMFVIENGVPGCVGLSHYKDGKFNQDHGRTSETLGTMYMLMVDKISKKGSFRNYTYIDEMKASALVQLSQVGLLFDEGRSANPNPFAFYTTVVTNVFKRVLNSEKRVRDTRDDLIEIAGHNPSYSRQSDDAWTAMNEQHEHWGNNTSESNIQKNRKNRT